jgi:hypothetical protein
VRQPDVKTKLRYCLVLLFAVCAWLPCVACASNPTNSSELLGYRGLTLDPVGHAGSLSLYDYCDNDPLNVFDPDGRFGKGVSSGWSGSISANAPNSSAFSAGMIFGGGTRGGVEGLGIGVQNVSGYTSYQSNLSMFDGDRYAASNAAWNPAYMAMRGFTEAGGGTGMQPHNLGQSLSTGQRVWSGVEGGLGTVGTVGVGFSGAALTRSVGLTGPTVQNVVTPRSATLALPAPRAGSFNPHLPGGSMTSFEVAEGGLLLPASRAHGANPAGSFLSANPIPNQGYVRGPLATISDWNPATHVSDAFIPQGVRLQMSIANPHPSLPGSGYGIQFQILNDADKARVIYSNTRSLQ